jgi:uncharacterized membrane protein
METNKLAGSHCTYFQAKVRMFGENPSKTLESDCSRFGECMLMHAPSAMGFWLIEGSLPYKTR